MVGNFTVGKERYAEHEADVQRLLAESERIRIRLLELMDEDARAFEPLAAAYAIPKDAPERAATLEAATKGALEAPLEMMRQVAAVIGVLEELRAKGSRMLLSDVGCGAARAASLNVFVNTKALQDRACADTANAEAEALLAAAVRADEVFAAVTDAERGA
jgi:formiminotetrahydrofolate cyclodeaminase